MNLGKSKSFGNFICKRIKVVRNTSSKGQSFANTQKFAFKATIKKLLSKSCKKSITLLNDATLRMKLAIVPYSVREVAIMPDLTLCLYVVMLCCVYKIC